MRRLRIAREEDGVALLMALCVMMVLSIVLVTALATTSSTTRHADRSKADQTAYGLAESGLNNALSQVASHYPGGTQYNNAWVSGSTGVAYSGGTSTWTGSFNTGTNKWTLTGTGTVKNPSTGGNRSKTVSANVNVTIGIPAAYTYGFFMGDASSPCTTFTNGAQISVSVYIASCLTITGVASMVEPVAGTPSLTLYVGKDFTNSNSSTNIGSAASRILSANIVGANPLLQPCVYAAVRQACGDASHVYAQPPILRLSDPKTLPDMSNTALVNGVAIKNAAVWNGAPSTCNNFFDNDATPGNSSLGTIRLFRSTVASYNCTAKNASGTTIGSLVWNQLAKTLVISGNVFIDGNLSVQNIDAVTYSGSGNLWINGTVVFANGASICGPGNPLSAGLVPPCSGNTWDPTLGTMLLIACNAGNVTPAFHLQGSAGYRLDAVAMANGQYQGTNGAQISAPIVAKYGDLSGAASIKQITSVPSGAPGTGSGSYTLGKPYDYH